MVSYLEVFLELLVLLARFLERVERVIVVIAILLIHAQIRRQRNETTQTS